jgi:hypothetical protein
MMDRLLGSQKHWFITAKIFLAVFFELLSREDVGTGSKVFGRNPKIVAY